eukprot:scaffold60_cov382-Prasinococcus_capsulatus_cf.AAC.2
MQAVNNCDNKTFVDEGYCSRDYGYSVSLSYAKDQLGAGIVRQNVLGDVVTAPNPYDVRGDDIVGSGGAVLFTWLLDWSSERVGHSVQQVLEGSGEEIAKEWELEFLRTAGELAERPEFGQIAFYYSAERAIEDEVREESSADTNLLVGSYAAVGAYVIIVLVSQSVWSVRAIISRCILAILAVVVVLSGISATLGLMVWCKIPLSPLSTQVLPFLLVAIGVNDFFVITLGGLDQTNPKSPIEER